MYCIAFLKLVNFKDAIDVKMKRPFFLLLRKQTGIAEIIEFGYLCSNVVSSSIKWHGLMIMSCLTYWFRLVDAAGQSTRVLV